MHKYIDARAVRRNKLKLRVFVVLVFFFILQQKVPLHGSSSPEGYIALEKSESKKWEKMVVETSKKKKKKQYNINQPLTMYTHRCKKFKIKNK